VASALTLGERLPVVGFVQRGWDCHAGAVVAATVLDLNVEN